MHTPRSPPYLARIPHSLPEVCTDPPLSKPPVVWTLPPVVWNSSLHQHLFQHGAPECVRLLPFAPASTAEPQPLPHAPRSAPAAGGAAPAAGGAKSSSDSMISAANGSCCMYALRKYSNRVSNIHRRTFGNLHSFPNSIRSRALASGTSPTSESLALGHPRRRLPWIVAPRHVFSTRMVVSPYWPVCNAHIMLS